MLTLLLTAIVFFTTRQILRSDEQTPTTTQTVTPDPVYTARATFDETPYLDPQKVMAINLSLLLP